METILLEYDDLLIGKRDEIDPNNFNGTLPTSGNQRTALKCFRYAIEQILKWTPDIALNKFDKYMIEKMKLDRFLRYIDFPVEVPQGDPRYILHLLYPNRIKITQQSLTTDIYESILNADEKQFPRDYFSGGRGFQRFCFCIKYLLEHYHPVRNIEEIYEFFLSPEGKKALQTYRLQTPMYQFNIDILSVIRYITKLYPDGELYYNYFKFKQQDDNLK